MHALVDIKKYREDKNGTDLMIYVPDMQLGDMLRKKRIQNAETDLMMGGISPRSSVRKPMQQSGI